MHDRVTRNPGVGITSCHRHFLLSRGRTSEPAPTIPARDHAPRCWPPWSVAGQHQGLRYHTQTRTAQRATLRSGQSNTSQPSTSPSRSSATHVPRSRCSGHRSIVRHASQACQRFVVLRSVAECCLILLRLVRRQEPRHPRQHTVTPRSAPLQIGSVKRSRSSWSRCCGRRLGWPLMHRSSDRRSRNGHRGS